MDKLYGFELIFVGKVDEWLFFGGGKLLVKANFRGPTVGQAWKNVGEDRCHFDYYG